MNILDRIVLFRHSVTETIQASQTLRIFHTASRDVPLILKFSYAGNVQYHRLDPAELHVLAAEIGKALAAVEKAPPHRD